LPTRIRSILQYPQLRAGTVVYESEVQARYEHGDWHFENNVW